MSVKCVLKKKFKIKNPIAMKKKKQKHKHISGMAVDSYHKFDTDNIKGECLMPNKVTKPYTATEIQLKHENCHEINIDKDVTIGSPEKIRKKRKSVDSNTNNETPKKKKVTFAPDVKNEKDDQKCTAGKLKPLSLNKRKKMNYIKKLKAKKQKQKNAKKREENSAAINTSRHERAIEYLMQWKNDRSNWKFKKIFQLWLIKNTYDSAKVAKEHFEILVEYLQTIEGKSRDIIIQNASTIVSDFSALNEEQQELNLSQTNKYQRARTIIQMFG